MLLPRIYVHFKSLKRFLDNFESVDIFIYAKRESELNDLISPLFIKGTYVHCIKFK